MASASSRCSSTAAWLWQTAPRRSDERPRPPEPGSPRRALVPVNHHRLRGDLDTGRSEGLLRLFPQRSLPLGLRPPAPPSPGPPPGRSPTADNAAGLVGLALPVVVALGRLVGARQPWPARG